MQQWLWIEERDALAVHERSLVLHGGAPGVRDIRLLQSALARPRNLAAYRDNPSVTELAACYTTGLVQNHPFIDGNKRTGFVIGILFLELNGVHFDASEELAAEMVIGLASGQLEQAAYGRFLADHSGR